MDLAVRRFLPADLQRLAHWNRQLQEDEGGVPMPPAMVRERLRRLLEAGYRAHLFVADVEVGYALLRDADPEVEGEGVYIQQFFIDRCRRREGFGRAAFELLRTRVIGDTTPVLLEAVATNPEGAAFWRSLGFEVYATRFKLL